MNQHNFLRLIDRYLEGKASEEEVEWLHKYYDSFQHPSGWNAAELGSKDVVEERIWQRLKMVFRKRPQFSHFINSPG